MALPLFFFPRGPGWRCATPGLSQTDEEVEAALPFFSWRNRGTLHCCWPSSFILLSDTEQKAMLRFPFLFFFFSLRRRARGRGHRSQVPPLFSVTRETARGKGLPRKGFPLSLGKMRGIVVAGKMVGLTISSEMSKRMGSFLFLFRQGKGPGGGGFAPSLPTMNGRPRPCLPLFFPSLREARLWPGRYRLLLLLSEKKV